MSVLSFRRAFARPGNHAQSIGLRCRVSVARGDLYPTYPPHFLRIPRSVGRQTLYHRLPSLMNAILNRAIDAVQALPPAEQEAIARELLDRLEADARWDKLFASPRSEALLDRLAEEAAEDIERGRTVDGDPFGHSAS